MSDSAETSPSAYQGIPVAQVIPLKATRKLIADHMIQSHLTSARVTSLHEIDVTELVARREELVKSPEKTDGLKISYTHLLTKAVAQALRKHLILNSALVEKEILIFEHINIGVAMSLPDGNLIVPVIHRADQKSILEIAHRTKELEEKAQKGKLMVSDVQKGTFTLSNVGMLPESRWFTPIINQAQCAIFGTGAIRQIPAVREGQIVIRWVITTSVTYDHRILNNGIYIEYFIQTLAQLLGDPSQLELGL